MGLCGTSLAGFWDSIGGRSGRIAFPLTTNSKACIWDDDGAIFLVFVAKVC